MADTDRSSSPEKNKRTFKVDSSQKEEETLSVSEATARIRSILEKGIGEIWVKGEISNLSFPRSGHVYFDLKDEDAVLPVALFRREAESVEFDLEDGLEVRLYGPVSAYEKRGNYQIKAQTVLPLGEGALQLAFKQLREKLKKEGLYDSAHKQSLPFIPRKIGVVTSATGAAVRDIIRTIHSRFPPVHILVTPVKVQGDEASGDIVRAIQLLNTHDLVDVIITGRGGGSLEDLWAFNEEEVARAIFQSDIPVVSAVGHEVDTTISDLVADHTVPTPTAAGQGVVPDYEELMNELSGRIERLERRLNRIISDRKNRLDNVWKRLSRAHPESKLKRNREELIQKMQSIHREVGHCLDSCKERISSIAEQLESLNPLNVLKRGFSVTRNAKTNDIVRSTSSISSGDQVRTTVENGSFLATVEDVQSQEEEPDQATVTDPDGPTE